MPNPHTGGSSNKKPKEPKGCSDILYISKWTLGILIASAILFSAYLIIFVVFAKGTNDMLNITREMGRKEDRLIELTTKLGTITEKMKDIIEVALPQKESNRLMHTMDSTISQIHDFPYVNQQFISILATLNNVTVDRDAGIALLRIMEMVAMGHSQFPELLSKLKELLNDGTDNSQTISHILNELSDMLLQGQDILNDVQNITQSVRILTTDVFKKKELDIKFV